MKMIKNIIEYLIAISVIPAIVLTVINVTELKDVRNVQYELLSEEEGIYIITPGTYKKLVENKRIKNYELESNYPLITQDEMDRATWKINEDLKNEIYINENGEKRIKVNVGRLIVNPNDVQSSDKPDDVNTYRYVIPRSVLENKLNNFYFDTSSVLDSENYNWHMYADGFPHQDIQDKDVRGIEYRRLYGIWIRIERDIVDSYDGETHLQKFRNYLQENPLIIYYELADKQDRPVEVYDFSTFRLVFEKNRIKVLFDLDKGYYLWEITKDDKMIPINGQYDIGGIWTVKFYVYEIQQPMIRSLVLLIPIIVISGILIYMYNIIKKKGITY